MIILDTHVLAWADNDERKLGRMARMLINRHWARGEVAASAMSFWEIALLQARGRLDLPVTVDEWRGQLLAAGLIEFPVDGNVGIRAVRLGGLPNDPADRLIVATALHHDAALVSADERLLGWDHPMVRHDARV
ncbi:MAG: type II toxin-antitoxin system VapC family toxin [Betaproteobacteria bacterium]|nr:type II toxin-antitoxin system VapC family toxin [Betaproteobacteria bacterium]